MGVDLMFGGALAADAAEGTEEKWQPVSSPAPPPDPQATVLVDTEMTVSVHDFYQEFLSDKVHIQWLPSESLL